MPCRRDAWRHTPTMKPRYLLFSFLLFVSLLASSKDVIMRTDSTYIDAYVEEITETTIRYRKANNPSGPVYVIPISTVLKIVYDNGSTDNFNPPTDPSSIIQSITSTPSNTTSDKEPIQYANSRPSNANTMSDAQLLRYMANTSTEDQLYAKAKRYRLIGWLGGGVLLAATIIGTASINGIDTAIEYAAPAGGTLATLAWCTGFNIYASRLKNQARDMEFYSSSIIEDDIISFGDKSLTAGLSILGNHITHTQGYGLSLKLTF